MAVILYIVLGLLIVVSELRRRFRRNPVDAMTAFNFYYFVLFVLVPINVMYFGEDVVRQKYAYETFGSGDAATALVIFLSYLFFRFGFWIKSPEESRGGIPIAKRGFSLPDSIRVAKVIFFIGVLLSAVYAVQMGGIFQAISQARAVRYGETIVEGNFVFYRYFSEFSADAFVLFCVVLLGKRIRKLRRTTADRLYLLGALAFFLFYALSTGGRRELIYPILLCFLVHWSMGGHVKKTAVAALVLVFVVAGLGGILGPIILSGNASTAFDLINIDQADWPTLGKFAYENATSGLADSYIHFVGAQHAKLWQFGFLTDIVNLPQDLLPSRLLGFERTTHLYGQTTEFFTGRSDDPDDPTGIEPLGLHGYLLVNFGYVGMLAVFFVFGMLYRWIHSRLKPADRKDAVGWLIYWWFALAFFAYFRDGALILPLKQQLTWWVTTALLMHYRAKRAAMPRSSSAVQNITRMNSPHL